MFQVSHSVQEQELAPFSGAPVDTMDLSSMNLNTSQDVEVRAIELSKRGAAKIGSAHRSLFKLQAVDYCLSPGRAWCSKKAAHYPLIAL